MLRKTELKIITSLLLVVGLMVVSNFGLGTEHRWTNGVGRNDRKINQVIKS